MDHFGPFWSREYQDLVWSKVILAKMVVLTILDHFGPVRFSTVLRWLLINRFRGNSAAILQIALRCQIVIYCNLKSLFGHLILSKLTKFFSQNSPSLAQISASSRFQASALETLARFLASIKPQMWYSTHYLHNSNDEHRVVLGVVYILLFVWVLKIGESTITSAALRGRNFTKV